SASASQSVGAARLCTSSGEGSTARKSSRSLWTRRSRVAFRDGLQISRGRFIEHTPGLTLDGSDHRRCRSIARAHTALSGNDLGTLIRHAALSGPPFTLSIAVIFTALDALPMAPPSCPS